MSLDFILVAGAGTETTDGIYALCDSTAVGYDRVWVRSDPELYVSCVTQDNVRYWVIGQTPGTLEGALYTLVVEGDAPLSEYGYLAVGGAAPGPTVAKFKSELTTVTECVEDVEAAMYNLKLDLKQSLISKQSNPADAAFYQYPDYVDAIQSGGGGGGSATYYKCAEVGLPEEPVELPEPIFNEPFSGSLTNNFTQLGSAPEFTTIEGRQCMVCNHEHRLSAPATNMPSGNSARTISARVYFNSLYDYAFYFGYGGDDYNTFDIGTQHSSLLNYHRDNSISMANMNTGQWYHIVMTFDGTTMKSYVNGTVQGSYEYNYDTNITDYPIYIGYLGSQADNTFNQDAYISDAQIYDVALTAEQVAELYQPTASSLPANTWSGYKAYLVEDTENDKKYYQFEETLTTDALTWGYGYTPEIGSVYDAEALVRVELWMNRKPFRLTALTNDGFVQLNSNGTVDSSKLYYRTNIGGDETDWALYTPGTGIDLPTAGDYIEFENRQEKFSVDSSNYFYFRVYNASTWAYNPLSPSGNIMSLLNYSDTCTAYCFLKLFQGSDALRGSLTLPAKTLANNCYQHMLDGGTNTGYDFEGMEIDIQATTLASRAFSSFYNSSYLKSIRVAFTEWSPDDAFSSWLHCSMGFSTTTFYKPSALPEEYSGSRIPSGATAVNID